MPLKDMAMERTAEEKLPLMEHFYTIQGEGFNTGRAAYFLRLGGCDVGCVWCDVKESWPAENHGLQSVSSLVILVKKSGAENCVVTGGEPLMYDLGGLTNSLREAGLKTWLETSGAYALSGTWDWICVSPKKFKPPIREVVASADELKVIVYNKSDFNWAEKHAVNAKKDCALFLQPEYSVVNKMMPLIIDYVKAHPQWRISLQTHKIINVP